MKYIYQALFWLVAMGAWGAPSSWYIAREVTGTSANDGTSWADAWTNLASIAWASPQAGDTIYVSGGPSGGTNIYIGNLSDQAGSPVDGSVGSPITIKASREAGRNGTVKVIGGIFISKKYWIIDGSKSDWIPDSVMDTYGVGTNCNIEVYQTNATMAVQVFGTGAKVKWVHVSEMSSYDDTAIYVAASAPSPCGDGAEVAYNWISEANGFGIRAEISDWVADTFGQLAVHHNLIEGTHDNYIQISGHVDIYKNVGRYQAYPTAGHPDVTQEVNAYSRIWNNIFSDNQGYGVYVEANEVLTHNLYVYNNVFFSTTNGITSIVDITGHDKEEGQACNLSNIWIFNNTAYNLGTTIPAKFVSWNRGNTETGRVSGWVTNFNVFNNCVIGVAPENDEPVIQLYTNLTTQNGVGGFSYATNEVRVDYNSINGMSGNGRGIIYGVHGNASPLDYGYGTMADFAAGTDYKSNNNNAAVFVSLTNRDYRPQVGDLALVGYGTNLASITNIALEGDYDINGVYRGTAWDIGAYQHPSGYWVATNGNDSTGDGTFQNPWRTISNAVNEATTAGDIVNVTPGNYAEYVETAANGTVSDRITFRAYPANDPNYPVELRQFRVKHQYITIEGFKLRKTVGINGAMVAIEQPGLNYNGSGCIVTNNTICDGVLLISKTADFGSNYIHIRNAVEGTDFNTAGFVPGMSVYIGSDSINTHTNTGDIKTVLSNSADGLYMHFTTSLDADSGTNYWVPVVAGGNGPTSWRGVSTQTPNSGYGSISNIIIAGNALSNLIGVGIDLGQGCGTNRVINNTITRMHGGYAMRLYAANLECANNLIIDDLNIIWWTAAELGHATHPGGGEFYDWQCNHITCGGVYQTNVDFHHNWIESVDNQLLEINNNDTNDTFRVHHNVFIGSIGPANASINNLTIDNNTFFRVAYDLEGQGVLQLGPLPSTGQTAQTNLTVASNIFVNFGGHFNLSQESPYAAPAPTSVTNGVYLSNYTVWPETMGWSNTVVPTGAFGSGDPLFVNIRSPRGPDGLPFTDDDGLRPLPNSTIAAYGLGALQPVASNRPWAHISIADPAMGWKDATGTNYDLAWVAMHPHDRTGVMRPWNQPEAIGTNSATVIFSATNSVDGLANTNTGISSYGWSFNGSNRVVTTIPIATNTFTTAVTNWVTLYITNSSGDWAVSSNAYRMQGEIGGGEPEPPAPGTGRRVNVVRLNAGTFKSP